MFGYSDPNTGIDQSQRLFCTCYFIMLCYYVIIMLLCYYYVIIMLLLCYYVIMLYYVILLCYVIILFYYVILFYFILLMVRHSLTPLCMALKVLNVAFQNFLLAENVASNILLFGSTLFFGSRINPLLCEICQPGGVSFCLRKRFIWTKPL